MTAEIINVGTEILLGNIVNTNARFIANKLKDYGFNSYYQSVVGDNAERLTALLKTALKRSDFIFITGGLGPTYDDITKEVVSETLGLPLELHEESLKHIKEYFNKIGREFTHNNIRQAYMPKGAIVFKNKWGTANALAVENNGKTIFLLPGPPREMCPIFEEYIIPILEKKIDGYIVKRSVRIFGMGEAMVESKLYNLLKNSINPSVAPYAKEGEVLLQVTAKAETKSLAFDMTEKPVKEIKETIGEYVYGIDVENLEERVVSLLKEKSLKIATAESCTGGLLSKRITDIKGASNVFEYGAVTYSNEAKINMLGVSPDTISSFGAISPETAAQMAEGIRKLSNADIGVSISGNAGPDSSEGKPVGLVFIGLSTKDGTKTIELNINKMGADRDYIRTIASSNALDGVRRIVEGLQLPQKI